MLENKKILVTGGAGFIGSNLIDELLNSGCSVVCLDNFSTGHFKNLNSAIENKSFELQVGDIRNLKDCQNAVKGVDFVLHQAALGSVPRSISDPITSNDVNVSGFLNMLTAARDAGVRRFVYAASSSTYGDSESLPKIEDVIGKPLSPYAITKYLNELYADVFSKTYGIECIGLRYFNVFGKRQDPNGAYAAVIPKFIKSLINHTPVVINGDGSYSRDFTHIYNVLLMNKLALTTDVKNTNTVYNTACGGNISLNELVIILKKELSVFDKEIANVIVEYGPNRIGDIPHSLASIEKASLNLGYKPLLSVKEGLNESINWYWNNLK